MRFLRFAISARVAVAVLSAVLLMGLLAGCGGSTTTTRTVTGAGAARQPSCGKYCQQAGLPAGQQAPGYPCPQSGCMSCPPGGCVTLLSRSAVVSGGVTHIDLKCGLNTTCNGAVLLCFPFANCEPAGGTASGAGGRLAASDFSIPAGQTAQAPVAVTSLGATVAQLQGGYRADVLLDVAEYGIVNAHTPGAQFSQTSMSHVALTLVTGTGTAGTGAPGGARKSCNAAPPLFVGSNTSCQFGAAVYRAWEQGNRPATVSAVSPVTKKSYMMSCVGSSPVVCTGGVGARVVFYA